MKNHLYTYTIPYDDGAAPNPFHGVCTLAICKPGIRRTAIVGDWVAAFGSQNAPSGDLSGRLVYAMKVSEVITLSEYNRRATLEWPEKIPDIKSTNPIKRLGDCIYYDFEIGNARQRSSVHNEGNIETDLNGKNVLISNEFYYFGLNAIELDPSLKDILHQTQGYKKQANDRYFTMFVDWLEKQNFKAGHLYGWPDMVIDWSDDKKICAGCVARKNDLENDIECVTEKIC